MLSSWQCRMSRGAGAGVSTSAIGCGRVLAASTRDKHARNEALNRQRGEFGALGSAKCANHCLLFQKTHQIFCGASRRFCEGAIDDEDD
jgi:hypothetical protein